MDEPEPARTYFTVTDECGKRHPAMEYLAGSLDEQPVFQVIALKRFLKLIGSGEHLQALGGGRFVGTSSGRIYCAQVAAATTRQDSKLGNSPG